MDIANSGEFGDVRRRDTPGPRSSFVVGLDATLDVDDDDVGEDGSELGEAEGAGAASFAAAWQERGQLNGQVVGTTLCGGNVDSAVLAEVLTAGPD